MASTSSSSAHCSAINCFNRQTKRLDLSFFKFPKNKERCQKWVQNTRRSDLLQRTPLYVSSNCRLCSEHFEIQQFSNKWTKNRLNWNAIPTILQVPNPPKPLSTPRRLLKRKSEVVHGGRVAKSSTAARSYEQYTNITYIAGYLCRKVITGHEVLSSCQICRKALLKENADLDNPALLFTHYKAYDTSTSDFGSLMVPSERFLAFCTECENLFRTEFDDIKMTRSNISHLLNRAMCDLPLYKEMQLCSERIKSKIVAVFVNIRMHYALKFKNREVHNVTLKRKCRKVDKVAHK